MIKKIITLILVICLTASAFVVSAEENGELYLADLKIIYAENYGLLFLAAGAGIVVGAAAVLISRNVSKKRKYKSATERNHPYIIAE